MESLQSLSAKAISLSTSIQSKNNKRYLRQVRVLLTLYLITGKRKYEIMLMKRMIHLHSSLSKENNVFADTLKKCYKKCDLEDLKILTDYNKFTNSIRIEEYGFVKDNILIVFDHKYYEWIGIDEIVYDFIEKDFVEIKGHFTSFLRHFMDCEINSYENWNKNMVLKLSSQMNLTNDLFEEIYNFVE